MSVTTNDLFGDKCDSHRKKVHMRVKGDKMNGMIH